MTFPNIHVPLHIRALEEAFIIGNATGRLLGAFYFGEGDEIRRQVCKCILAKTAVETAPNS